MNMVKNSIHIIFSLFISFQAGYAGNDVIITQHKACCNHQDVKSCCHNDQQNACAMPTEGGQQHNKTVPCKCDPSQLPLQGEAALYGPHFSNSFLRLGFVIPIIHSFFLNNNPARMKYSTPLPLMRASPVCSFPLRI